MFDRIVTRRNLLARSSATAGGLAALPLVGSDSRRIEAPNLAALRDAYHRADEPTKTLIWIAHSAIAARMALTNVGKFPDVLERLIPHLAPLAVLAGSAEDECQYNAMLWGRCWHPAWMHVPAGCVGCLASWDDIDAPDHPNDAIGYAHGFKAR